MNKLLLALAFISSFSVFAADSSEVGSNNHFLFRIEPQWIVFSEVKIDLQFKLTDNFTLGPTLGYMGNGDGVFYETKTSNHLFYSDRTNRTTLGVRGVYYFNGMETRGAFISGFGHYAWNQVTAKEGLFTTGDRKGKFNELSVGATAGYQWVWLHLLTLNVGGGLAYFNHPSSFTLTDSAGATSNYDLGNSSALGYALDVGFGLQF